MTPTGMRWNMGGWNNNRVDKETREKTLSRLSRCHTSVPLRRNSRGTSPRVVIVTTYWTCFTSAVCRQMGGGLRMKSVSRGNFARQLGNKFSPVRKRLSESRGVTTLQAWQGFFEGITLWILLTKFISLLYIYYNIYKRELFYAEEWMGRKGCHACHTVTFINKSFSIFILYFTQLALPLHHLI